MNQATLYQWPSAFGTESIYPRCVVFQRICNIAKHPIKVVNIRIPQAGESFGKELQTRLINLPILEVGDMKYTTSEQIIEYLIKSDPSRESKAKLIRLASAHSFMIQQWANESFINSLVYVRWLREENFQRFSKNVRWDRPLEEMKPEVEALRQEILKYLKRTPLGGMDEKAFHEMLKNQLWSLNHILEAQDFLEPMVPHPTMTDLKVFMVIQGLLSPDLEESKLVKEQYAAVFAWAKRVDQLTART